MAQFDVYRNPNPNTRSRIPYLLDVQAGLLDALTTRVVAPLCEPDLLKGRLAERLNPTFEVEGRSVVLLPPELAGVPRKALGECIGNLTNERFAIVAALDFVFTGI